MQLIMIKQITKYGLTAQVFLPALAPPPCKKSRHRLPNTDKNTSRQFSQ